LVVFSFYFFFSSSSGFILPFFFLSIFAGSSESTCAGSERGGGGGAVGCKINDSRSVRQHTNGKNRTERNKTGREREKEPYY
jgi:hypothetical protein